MSNIEQQESINLITGQKILVAEKAFGDEMDWDTAKSACEEIGEGWRLPSRNELLEISKKYDELNLSEDNYWSSTEGLSNSESAGRVYVTKDSEVLASENKYWLSGKGSSFKVVAVKSISHPYPLFMLKELECEGKIIEVADKDLAVATSFFEAKEGCELMGERWRMPTNKEMEIIREELHYKGLGDFKDEMYWSIVQDGDSGYAEGWFFSKDGDGPPFVDEEQNAFFCRPVRDKQ